MKAAFFGGAKSDRTTKEYSDTIRIGEILYENGYEVKCGGYYGLMEAISIGNRYAIGVICRSIGPDNGNIYLNDTIITEDIYDRLRILIEDTDLFIVQKGGLGTLAELFLTLDIMRKRKNVSRIILIGEFWRDIFNSINILLNEREMDMIIIIDDIEKLNKII